MLYFENPQQLLSWSLPSQIHAFSHYGLFPPRQNPASVRFTHLPAWLQRTEERVKMSGVQRGKNKLRQLNQSWRSRLRIKLFPAYKHWQLCGSHSYTCGCSNLPGALKPCETQNRGSCVVLYFEIRTLFDLTCSSFFFSSSLSWVLSDYVALFTLLNQSQVRNSSLSGSHALFLFLDWSHAAHLRIAKRDQIFSNLRSLSHFFHAAHFNLEN